MRFAVHHRADGAGEAPRPSIVFVHGGNIANWMWSPQVDAFTDYHVITPDLPGFGARTPEPWRSLEASADDIATLLTGPTHVVGLSLGGVVAAHLAARHPHLVASVLTTGAPLEGVSGPTHHLARLQLRLWDRPWFWRGQARMFGLPADVRDEFVAGGLAISRVTAERAVGQVLSGTVPLGLAAYPGPYLALAGEREQRSVRDSFAALRDLVPQAVTGIAPGMHHAWSIEDVGLFNTVVRTWIEQGKASDELTHVQPGSTRGSTPPVPR